MASPGSILPGGIVVIDEPESIGVMTIVERGEVILNVLTRAGGNCGQVLIGLTPNQAMELIRRLHAHDDVYARAIAEGKGGAGFKAEVK